MMIGAPAYRRVWEDDFYRSQPADYERNLHLVEALWEDVVQPGSLPSARALDIIPAKTRRERIFMFRHLLGKIASEFERRSIP